MNWQDILANPGTAELILLTIFHSLWLSITGLFILHSRRLRASTSRATWCVLVILLLIILPLMTLYIPRFEVNKHSDINLTIEQGTIISGTDSSKDYARLVETTPLMNRWLGMDTPVPSKWTARWILFLNGAGILWVVFTLSYFGKIFYELVYLRGYSSSLEEVNDVRITTIMQEMKERYGFWRVPRFCLSPTLASPISLGIRRLLVIFPSQLYHNIDELELRAVLFHELAHIYHHDHMLGLLQRCIKALYWWNPFVHRLCNTLLVAREEVSDNYAISGMGSASKYAALLINLAEKCCLVNRMLCTAGMANPYISLEARIKRLLSEERDISTKTNRKTMLMTLSVIVLFCGFIIIGNQVEVLASRQTSQDLSFTNIDGWFIAGDVPQNYKIGKDEDIYYTDYSSYYISSKTDPTEGFGTIMQNMLPDEYLGHRVRMSAYIKAEDVQGWAGMWMRVDGKSPQTSALTFDNMQNRPITGTTDWEEYVIVLDVPEEAQNIAFGVLIRETGKVWVDDVAFETVDNQVPTTGVDFSKTRVDGWFKAGDASENYEIGKDEEEFYTHPSSYYIASIIDSNEGNGTIMKSILPMEYRGYRVRMSAYIKVEDVQGWAGMWMRVDGKSEKYRPLAYDDMKNRPITGTTDWEEYEIVLDVPEEATDIAHGVLIAGPGKVWFDELHFAVVDDDVPVTGIRQSINMQLPVSE
jgi:beta-lactamase regulating signal transducer with metallopeptidase domain